MPCGWQTSDPRHLIQFVGLWFCYMWEHSLLQHNQKHIQVANVPLNQEPQRAKVTSSVFLGFRVL